MGRITIDTNEAMSFEPTEPGPYAMTIDEFSEPFRSKEAKTLCVTVFFAFANPDIAQKCGRVARTYTLEGKGAGFFRELWKAATGEDIPLKTQIDVDTDDAVGRPVIVTIGNEEYEGRLQNRAEKVVAAA